MPADKHHTDDIPMKIDSPQTGNRLRVVLKKRTHNERQEPDDISIEPQWARKVKSTENQPTAPMHLFMPNIPPKVENNKTTRLGASEEQCPGFRKLSISDFVSNRVDSTQPSHSEPVLPNNKSTDFDMVFAKS